MASTMTQAEMLKIVDATAGPVTTNGGVNGDYVTLKNAHKLTIIAQLTQAVGHATVLAITQATAVAGTGDKAITNAVQIWANEDTDAGDALVRQTDAVSYTVAADIKKKMVVFSVDPATLDQNNGFDVVRLTVSDSSQATNFVAATYHLKSRYPGATPPGGPSAIVD